MPYRERLRLIINELGAAVAGNGQALNEALHRANPALRDTDRVLAVLARQRNTISDLTSNADRVITALAQNKGNVTRFVVEAKRTAQASAERRVDLQATFHKFPAFLEELKPTMAALGRTADAQRPALANLAAAAPELVRFFHDLVPFSQASTPSFKALGKASVTGREALNAAGPTIALLNRFARKTPEVGKNLAIILKDLDNPKRAVEADPRASVQTQGHQSGYTALQALLQYVFNQAVAINSYDNNGQHLLRVNAFADDICGPYTDTAKLKDDYHNKDAARTRRCLSYLGRSQPAITSDIIPGFRDTCDPSLHHCSGSASSRAAATRARPRRPAKTAPRRPTTAKKTPQATGPGIGNIIQGVLGGTPPAPGSPLPKLPGLPKPPAQAPGSGAAGLLNYLLAP
jgi:ABC-type transporter Mla subunit MlaD